MRTFASLRFPALLLATAFAFATGAGCAATDDDGTGEEDGESSIPASLDLWQSTDGGWHFHLVAGNGNNLMTSESYTTREGALNGILSVLDNGGYESNYVAVKNTDGKYHLNLRAPNNQIIATTDPYSTKSSATRGITTCAHAVSGYLAAWDANTAARAQVIPTETAFHFNIYAANGQIVLTSESYTTEGAALNGAFSAVDNGKTSSHYEIRTSTGGGYYFVLKGANGEIVGTSQQYTTKSSAERGRDALIALLPSIDLL